MPSKTSHKTKQSPWLPLAITGIGVIVVAFAAFVIVHKHAPTTGSPQPSSGPASQTYGSSPNCQADNSCPSNQSNRSGTPPVEGKITALSSSSISVQPSDGSAVKKFTITSASTIEQSGGSKPYKASDLHAGEKVAIVATPSDATKVESVVVGGGSTHSQQE